MIVKVPRSSNFEDKSDIGKYNLRVMDKNGNSFVMMVGGNGDLYWVPNNYKKNKTFIIEKSDEFVYDIFDKLFVDMQTSEDKNHAMQGNEFNFISDDAPEDEANTLKIRRDDNAFVVDFIKQEIVSPWSTPSRGCSIRFCNAGSRQPKIVSLFMRMFSELAYYNNDIDMVME